jgi:hypothetical protein
MWYILERRKMGTGWGDLKERDHYGRPRCSWGAVKMDLEETGLVDMHCIQLDHCRGKWRGLTNEVMNSGVQ